MEYEVLSPWAEIEPVPLRGISPRATDLTGKTIGMLGYFKKWARPILSSIEQKLRERFPSLKFSYYVYSEHNIEVMKSENKDKLQEWAMGVDSVISVFGD